MQNKNVAFLGPVGSFGHVLAEQFFSCQFIADCGIPCPDNGSVVRIVANDSAGWGVVPIENSTEGPVGATLNALYDAWQRETPVQIHGQVIVPIEHCITGLSGLEEIDTVMTHPQAYGQCRRYLLEKFGNLTFIPTNSTAEGIRLMVEIGSNKTIAIGHRRAADIYGAKVLANGVQDQVNNRTRFIVISNQNGQQPTGNDQTIVMLSCAKDTPGSLVEVLMALSGHGVNMNMVMSLPGDAFEHYRFCFGFAGHCLEPKIACAIDEMRKRSEWLYVFGSFPQ